MTNCTGKRCPVQVGKVDPAICEAYKDCQWATRPLTNADHIRAMTDEEMAEWFSSKFSKDCDLCPDWIYERDCPEGCVKKWLKWLKREVQG